MFPCYLTISAVFRILLGEDKKRHILRVNRENQVNHMVSEPFVSARTLMDRHSRDYDLSKAAQEAEGAASSNPDAKYLYSLFQ